jgi:hypothetical protein
VREDAYMGKAAVPDSETLRARGRTAMARTLASRPVTLAMADSVIRPGVTVFDYGCGRGSDLRHLRHLGIDARGWDPVFAPLEQRVPADVVNLGYVVNVIEGEVERAHVLRSAWALARRALVVAARLHWEQAGLTGQTVGDGLVTMKGTFQRFYRQDELRAWIDAELGCSSVAAAPGIFYVFRERSDGERLLAERARRDTPAGGLRISDLLFEQHRPLLDPLQQFVAQHRRLPSPLELSESASLSELFGSVRSAFLVIRRVTGAENWSDVGIGEVARGALPRFNDHQEILQPLMDFLEGRGRLPHPGELANEAEIHASLGGLRRAFSLICRATGSSRWKEFAARRKEDFLIYVALSAFGGRPRFSELSEDLQHDARDFFGSYREACRQADLLLFAAGDPDARNAAFKECRVGKLTPEALYLHISGIGHVSPVIRVYEGCGRVLTGTVANANVIKLHRIKSQVSYLSYPEFDRDPHPALSTVVVSRLARLDVSYRDFHDSANPPVLHRKETFVGRDYPGREKFARLTEQEEHYGLLKNSATIGTLDGWNERLQAEGWVLRGHRLVRRPESTPAKGGEPAQPLSPREAFTTVRSKREPFRPG